MYVKGRGDTQSALLKRAEKVYRLQLLCLQLTAQSCLLRFQKKVLTKKSPALPAQVEISFSFLSYPTAYQQIAEGSEFCFP